MARTNPLLRTNHNEKVWIIVADEAVAKVFAVERGQLRFLHQLTAPSETLTGLTNDRVGRNAGGGQHHKYEPSMTESRQVSISFAKTVCEKVSAFSRQNEFQKLVLVAAPKMLGLLRANFSKETQEKITAEIDKELTGREISDLEEILPGLIDEATA